MTTIEQLDDRTTLTRSPGRTVRSTHATKRTAEIHVAATRLRAAGWRVHGPSTGLGFRRPILAPGEAMGEPLDGSRADERAQGFTATRGHARLTVDASVGLPVLVLEQHGDTTEAEVIVRGALS